MQWKSVQRTDNVNSSPKLIYLSRRLSTFADQSVYNTLCAFKSNLSYSFDKSRLFTVFNELCLCVKCSLKLYEQLTDYTNC